MDGTLAPPPRFHPPTSQTPNIKHLAWKQTDQSLLNLLLSSLTEEAMAEVMGLTTSRAVGLALKNSFSHRSKAREIHLKDYLQLMKRCTHTVTEYARTFKSLCNQLHAIGWPVDGTNKSHWFLQGLGSNFTTFFHCTNDPNPLPSFADLVSKFESLSFSRYPLNNRLLPPLLSQPPTVVTFGQTREIPTLACNRSIEVAMETLPPTAAVGKRTYTTAQVKDAIHNVAKFASRRATMSTGATKGMHGVTLPPTLPRL